MDPTVSDSFLQEEYRLLGQVTTPRPRTEAEYNHAHASATLPCNKTKNRYTDVLPVEATRIKLAPRDDEPGSDYINANQVTDPTPVSDGIRTSNDHYICAQAPLQNTLNDFWRMVWEQDVCMIVVLMRLSENGKVKGHRYWPKRTRRSLQFGEVAVSLVKGKHFPHRSEDPTDRDADQTTIRVLELKRGENRRNIVQLHFKDWPDFGVPESTEPIRNLVRIMDFYRSKARMANINGPVVIHCSAGIGRTGTYLAIVFALNAIKHLKQAEQQANGTEPGAEQEVELAFQSESPSYSDDDFESHSSSHSSRYSTPKGVSDGNTSSSGFGEGLNLKSPMSPSKQPISVQPALASLHLTTYPSSMQSNSKSVVSGADSRQGASISGPPSPSHQPPQPSGRIGLTLSGDSVEYETTLMIDSDDDTDGEGSSYESSNPDEDEQDMMEIRAYQRSGSTIPVDIMKIVLSLRKQRNRGMVQTEDQYKFIYRVVLDEIHQQKLHVTSGVLQFMTDAANDFTDAAPLSARLSNSRRKSQPRSPRSTQISLGSSVSIGASGLSRLSSSTISNSNISNSSSLSDDEGERKKARLRVSGDSHGPLLSLGDTAPDSPVFIAKRNLAMSSANIQPLTDSAASNGLLTQSDPPSGLASPQDSHPPSSLHTASKANAIKNGSKSPLHRRSSPPGTTTPSSSSSQLPP